MIKKFLMMCIAAISAMGAWGAFQCEVQVPAGDVGVSRTATVTYSNNGASAIAAPYVRIEAGDSAYVRFSETDAWSKSVEFLATSRMQRVLGCWMDVLSSFMGKWQEL